jgi:putative OPT family oligopeptide transporter
MADPAGITGPEGLPTARPEAVTTAPELISGQGALAGEAAAAHKPYVPEQAQLPEFTWPAVLVGAVLGIIFGASSLYLLLKVGMTVSASVPIAVLSITLFRFFSRSFGFRRATILENNIVQTAGSAGESLAFGVGVTMPALLLLGFEMHWTRVMTVAVLGGLLGILMMIPLRRAFIVQQHGKLKYPEGTACAEVLVAGEKGGASARMVFLGFGIAFVYKFFTAAGKLWAPEPEHNLYAVNEAGNKVGLKGAAIGGDLSPEMLGVGYLIGPRIACLMMAGAVLSFFVIGPLIATFGENLNTHVAPAVQDIDKETKKDKGLIRNMGPGQIYNNYLRYIGAGAVAAGGIISMVRALPLILASIVAGLRDLRSSAAGGPRAARTDRDLSMTVVIVGSLALVVALAAVPQLGLGLTVQGVLGAIMILLFGFLFVTVSSRLTGEVGSSSNPISGMTIATLLLTCLIFVLVGLTDVGAMLTALSVAAVVCIASSNGGTTSQDLKTGYLVGATPKYQQYAILIGALTSAVVIGGTMLALNKGSTHYTKKGFPAGVRVDAPADAPRQKVGQPHTDEDDKEYRAVFVRRDQYENVPRGWYLVDDSGRLTYRIDVPIDRKEKMMDKTANAPEREAPERFKAPQPQLFAIIIEGILSGELEWGLVSTGALIAVVMELMGISALPVAVGMYLGLGTAMPIFFGGMLRWLTDRWRGVSASEAETETSPGVLMSSGYIAGGTLCGLLIGFLVMLLPKTIMDYLNLGQHFGTAYNAEDALAPKVIALVVFAAVAAALGYIGSRKEPLPDSEQERPPGG